MLQKNKIILFLLSFSLILSCTSADSQFQISVESSDDVIPDQISYNIEIAFIDSNITKTFIKAGRARVYNEKKETILDSGVIVNFYNDSGQRTGVLTSTGVTIDDVSKDMFAAGNVVVVSDSIKTTLRTEVLNWRQSTRKIWTDVAVNIKSPSEIINGIGFESNEDLSNYKIYKVTGIKQ